MKCLILFLFAFSFQAYPSTSKAQNKISLTLKKASIEKVLMRIEQQTNYRFVYSDEVILNKTKLDVNVKDETLEKVLKEILKGLFLSYVQSSDNLIAIVKSNDEIIALPIKGRVVDVSGKPIVGASIVEKGTNNGTVSSDDGTFSLNVFSQEAKLMVSAIGYGARELKVTGDFLNIVLNVEDSKLEDVVVIGYGTAKRKDLTGAVGTVSPASYKNQPIVDISGALQGRVAGVSVSNSSGAPGGAVKIRVRGANSVNFTNDPLYVVDGIALGSASFSQLNIGDVESMEVLKDASATAIYGSRGANGVIIITTKKGRVGPPKVEYNGFLSFNKPMKKYDLMGPETYATVANLTSPGSYPNPSQYTGTPGTNWQDLIFAENATQQSHQISLAGGSEFTKYYVSGFYVNQDGLLLNTSQKKFGLRTNLNFKISNRLSADADIYLAHFNAHNNDDMGSKGNPVMSAITWSPIAPVYKSVGVYNSYISSPIWPQPYMTLRERSSNAFTNVGSFNGHIKYAFTSWLSLNVRAALDMAMLKNAAINNSWITNALPSASESSNESYTFQNSNSLEFHKAFKKHDISAIAVMESTTSNSNYYSANGNSLASANYGYYNLGLAASQAISSGYSNWALLSYLGRVTYDYNNKYLLTATIRRDGSSKFQGNNKWSSFPSFGVAWKASNEDFIKRMNLFSNLKIRGGWGVTGNQAIPPYSTLGLLVSSNFSYGTATPTTGYALGNPSSTNLKWETTKQADVGFDMGFFNNALSVSIDYYNKKTTGLLLNVPISYYNGGGSVLQNIGAVSNNGWEISIEATPVKKSGFVWNTTFNFSTNQNKLVSLGTDSLIRRPWPAGGLISTNIQVEKVGQPLGAFYLIPWLGVYQTADGAHKAGDPKYQDVSGNGSIGYEDQQIVGSAMPKFQFGFNNSFSYKNFELNIFIQGSQGNKIFNVTYAAAAVPSSDVASITLAEAANYWTPTNTGSTWANPANHTRSWVESTQFLQDGSYVRLKNISLAYEIGKKYLKVATAKIFVSAQNLYTLTKYKGFDPEATSTPSNSDADNGIDVGAYPSPKTVTVGVQLKF